MARHRSWPLVVHGGRPDEMAVCYYGDGLDVDPPGSVLGIAGPFLTPIEDLDVTDVTFGGDTIWATSPEVVVLRTTAEGHLLAVRLDSLAYAGASSCVSGVIAGFI